MTVFGESSEASGEQSLLWDETLVTLKAKIVKLENLCFRVETEGGTKP